MRPWESVCAAERRPAEGAADWSERAPQRGSVDRSERRPAEEVLGRSAEGAADWSERAPQRGVRRSVGATTRRGGPWTLRRRPRIGQSGRRRGLRGSVGATLRRKCRDRSERAPQKGSVDRSERRPRRGLRGSVGATPAEGVRGSVGATPPQKGAGIGQSGRRRGVHGSEQRPAEQVRGSGQRARQRVRGSVRAGPAEGVRGSVGDYETLPHMGHASRIPQALSSCRSGAGPDKIDRIEREGAHDD
jgi:hypothetical protein